MEAPDIETSGADYATRFSGDVGRYFLDVQERRDVDVGGDPAHLGAIAVGAIELLDGEL